MASCWWSWRRKTRPWSRFIARVLKSLSPPPWQRLRRVRKVRQRRRRRQRLGQPERHRQGPMPPKAQRPRRKKKPKRKRQRKTRRSKFLQTFWEEGRRYDGPRLLKALSNGWLSVAHHRRPGQSRP